MPIEGNVRYRFRPISGGKKQRLAFRDGNVVEAATFSPAGHKMPDLVHTPAEFAADSQAAAQKKTKRQPLRLRGHGGMP